VAACEIEEYPRAVLLQRQLDGILPRFPIWDDINTFNGKPFKGKIDIITGGFPCQDISVAGKGSGISGERSGLWKEMYRIISEVRPRFAFVENSPTLTSRGLGTVLGDLAKIGYDAEWCVLGADDVGAPHRRKRIWILAYANQERLQIPICRPIRSIQEEDGSSKRSESSRRIGTPWRITWWDEDPADIPDSDISGLQAERAEQQAAGTINNRASEKRQTKPGMGRMANGVANRVDILKAIGNGQVPAVAAVAFLSLYNRIIATTYET
jgi:DNA (cytosine-5)-methyltransferase 1